MAETGHSLTREFIAERDLRIFKMRQAGVPIHEISRRLNMSNKAVTNALQRQLGRMNREALNAYPEVLRMELERLDALQQAIWPLTQHRRITLPDGTETAVEPDLKAIQQVLSIMDRRAKLLGMEQNVITLNVDTGEDTPQRAALAGANQATDLNTYDPETEARELLAISAMAGIITQDVAEQLLGEKLELPAAQPQTPQNQDHIIIEAEIIE